MSRVKKLPETVEIVKMMEEGKTMSDIARQYGVSRQAVFDRLRRREEKLAKEAVQKIREAKDDSTEQAGQ